MTVSSKGDIFKTRGFRFMRYLTGIHALNLNYDALETCGDWHQSALKWDRVTIQKRLRNSEDSVFGDYGIEPNVKIPEHEERFYVANHIRALLDLLEMGMFSVAQGMKEDFICNDKYTPEIFEKVSMLRQSPLWFDIDRFMSKEYRSEWFDFTEDFKGADYLYDELLTLYKLIDDGASEDTIRSHGESFYYAVKSTVGFGGIRQAIADKLHLHLGDLIGVYWGRAARIGSGNQPYTIDDMGSGIVKSYEES